MPTRRNAHAIWKGFGKDGNGMLRTQSNVLRGANYSYKSRFESGEGTNPEELIGAAHAGCFSMKLAFNLQEAGVKPELIETFSTITLDNGAITEAHLETKVKAPGLDDDNFQKLAQNAKENCPVSKLLNTNITLKAELEISS
jgi:osmotically inducible protein OsmC